MQEHDQNKTEKKPVDRVLEQVGVPDLISRLNGLYPKDLQTLLLEVFSESVQKITPSDVLARYNERYRYLGGGELDQRDLLHFDSLFYSAVPANYRGVEFSPTGPLGTNASLTKLSQDIVPSTIRNSEVVSDPTVMLALEAARVRKPLLQENPNNVDRVRLCTSSRVLRLQPFDPKFGYMQHFRVFAAVAAGHNDNFNKFLADSATEHLSIFLDFIDKLNVDNFFIKNVVVYLSNLKIMEHVISASEANEAAIRRNTQTVGFKPFEEYGVKLPSTTTPCQEIDAELLKKYEIERSWKFLSKTNNTVIEPLKEKYSSIKFGFDLARHAGIGYYPNFCFHIYGTNKDGLTLQIADGGLTNWTKLLLNNDRELCMASGFGSELINKMFRK